MSEELQGRRLMPVHGALHRTSGTHADIGDYQEITYTIEHAAQESRTGYSQCRTKETATSQILGQKPCDAENQELTM